MDPFTHQIILGKQINKQFGWIWFSIPYIGGNKNWNPFQPMESDQGESWITVKHRRDN